MEAEAAQIVKLKCSVKNHDWGKPAKESSVAKLYSKNFGVEMDDQKPYAEFWMGTHESGPSYVVFSPCGVNSNGDMNDEKCELLSLKEWIEQNPRVLGDKVLDRWGPNLPFLFKVLSVEKALSIQAHPDKDLAVILHKQHPEMYDDNHKPEMAIALTQFEALCSFVDIKELRSVIHSVPEIIEVVGSKYVNQVSLASEKDGESKKVILRSLFTELMSANKAVISEVITKLIIRLHIEREVRELTEKEQLVLRLDQQYPGDVGVIASFLFNYMKLKPGEALYLGANEPHAYISGECIECMATSDNVVRAGLTPKNRDVQTLCYMLTYKQGLPETLGGVSWNPYIVKYTPPFDEFEVDRCDLPREESTVFEAVRGPSVFVVVAGEGKMCIPSPSSEAVVVSEGDVLFAPAYTEITVSTISGLTMYRAGVNSLFLEESDDLKMK